MGQYIIRRLIAMIPTLFVLSVFVFFIMRIMPGDVALLMLAGPEGEGAVSEEALEELRQSLGLNDPLPVQYVAWIRDLIVGGGGDSLWTKKPVYSEIAARLPATAQLTVLAIILGHVIAIPAGVISALKRNSLSDYFVRVASILFLAVPNFWLGIMIIVVMLYFFSWAIPPGYVTPFEDPVRNFKQMIFPTIVMGTALSATVARMTRATTLEVLREDFVRTARAKGLSENRVLVRHVLRNSILPVMTLSALQVGALLSGTVVVETVFSLPGIGRYLISSVQQRDYIVVQNLVLMFGALYMIINLLTDLAYAVVDPRIRFR